MQAPAADQASVSPSPPKPDPGVWRQIGRYAGLGFILPAAIFAGMAAGFGLDRWWHTGRTFELIGLLVGLAAGFLELYRAAMRP